jgi:hypothetical protein
MTPSQKNSKKPYLNSHKTHKKPVKSSQKTLQKSTKNLQENQLWQFSEKSKKVGLNDATLQLK